MGLVVPIDSRQPKMGCVDFKDREIVLFENGSLGYVDSDDDSDLRAGSSYVSIIGELAELKSPPNYSPSELDWPWMKKKYTQSLIIIYGFIVSLIVLPFVFQQGSWNDMISNWTGLDFNGWLRYILAFIASTVAFMPEIIGGTILSRRENQAVLTLDTKHGITEIIHTDGPMQFENQLSWKNRVGIFPLYMIVVPKVAFMVLIFIDFPNAVVLAILVPFVLFCLSVYAIYANRRGCSDDETKIPEVGLGEIFAFIQNRWANTQLQNIIAPGESIRLEFKSSLWYDYHKADKNHNRYVPNYDPSNKEAKNERAKSVVKTVAGFLNSDVEGTLLIGVDDDGQILGLECDFELLNTARSNHKDLYERQLHSLLSKHIESTANLRGLWDIGWLEHDEKSVCMLTISNSPQAVYHRQEGKSVYYRRTPSMTEPVPTGIELEKELEKFPR